MNPPANQIGLNAVTDLGLDSTGKIDAGAILNALFAANPNPPQITFPTGRYLLATTVVIPGTVKNLALIGEGRAAYNGNGNVQFLVASPAGGMWLKNSVPQVGAEDGPLLVHVNFVDTTPGQNAAYGLRISQFNNLLFNDLGFANFKGSRYATGKVTVNNGQTAFTGVGTTFTAAMQFGHLHIGGKLQEIASIGSPTTGQLSSAWQMPSGTYSYLITYGGKGLMLDGASVTGWTQYGSAYDIWGFNNLCWIHCVGSPSSIAGVSRIKFVGGRNGGNRVPDGIGLFLGKFTDTIIFDAAQNNLAFSVVIESAQKNVIKGQTENNSNFTVVTTAPAQGQAAIKGVVLNSDNPQRSRLNSIVDGYVYLCGNAIEFWSPNVLQTYISDNRLQECINNYAWADGTVGPPTKPASSAASTVALIHQLDYVGSK